MPLAQLPPMGWNSWNTFGWQINEKLIFEMADLMASQGYREAGYEYLVIDDCWSLRERGKDGRIVPDPEKFPKGGCRLRSQQGTEVRHVLLRGRADVRGLSRQL